MYMYIFFNVFKTLYTTVSAHHRDKADSSLGLLHSTNTELLLSYYLEVQIVCTSVNISIPQYFHTIKNILLHKYSEY